MNHTPAINVWKGTNRLSLFWEDLAANCVPPDPVRGKQTSPGDDAELAPSLPLAWDGIPIPSEMPGIQVETSVPALLYGAWERGRERPFLEKVSQGSIQWIRRALEVLTAPPVEQPEADTRSEQDMEILPVSQAELEAAPVHDPIQTASDLGLTFIKVSSEPEPQPGSAIDTRRMAYGLKIPRKPLHKRPIYQRVFFCLRQMMAR